MTKEDLWSTHRHEVYNHYSDGQFGKILKEVAREQGPNTFHFETVLVSLVIANFVTGENELLTTTAAGYEDRTRIESIRRLWQTIDALKSWGDE